ncbi:MAG: type 1 glutamine amidotransferase [Armatimonadota bacterium]|nr:MAG: type 1 glutamine amidotransferase [Armatimonadota bacterium]
MIVLLVAAAAIPSLSAEETKLKGKRIVILVEDQVNELEAIYPFFRLQEEGAKVEFAGRGKDSYKGEYGLTVEPVTLNAADLKVEDFDAVIVPGGYAPEQLRRDQRVTTFVRGMFDAGKVVASVCHGPQVLISAGILRGKRVTGYGVIKDDVINAGATWVDDEPVVRDGNLITSRWPEDMPFFCPTIIKALSE